MSAAPHRLAGPDEGTRAAFAAFVHAHADCVWRSLHALGVPDGAIEDAAQDVFLIAYRRFEGYEERGSPRSWLFAISQRVAANLRRRRHDVLPAAVERMPALVDVEEAVARREARALVDDFLAALPEERRVVFFLCDVEGWSAPEVAQTLALKLNTVYSRLRRARAQFEAYLLRQGVSG
jgi:RNA polymerase sigma-70 factor (ECF subfamily)